MKAFLKLSWRNLWRNKCRTALTISSMIFALVISICMRGLQLGTYEKMKNDVIRNSSGHLQLQGKGYWEERSINNTLEYTEGLVQLLKEQKEVQLWIPRLESFCLASSGEQTKGIMFIGTDPETEDKASGMSKKLVRGSYFSKGDQAIMIGEDLADFLKVDVKDTVVLFRQGYHGITAAGKYEVKGILHFPSLQMNSNLVVMNLPDAQYFYGTDNRLTSLSILLHDLEQSESIHALLQSKIDTAQYDLKHWQSMNEELVQQIESDQFFGYIMISILYLIVGFGILGTLMMMTMERRKELAVMISLGVRRNQLGALLSMETFFMAGIGLLIGTAISFPLIYFFHLNPIQITGEAAEMYRSYNMEPALFVSIRPGYMLSQALIVLCISLFASAFPLILLYRLPFIQIIRGR